MTYTADISRNNPGCFLFLIDQSASMTEALGGQPGLRKMDGAADAVNRILDAISQRCSQGMDVRDYFHIGVLTYSTDGEGRPKVESPLAGSSQDEPFLTVSQVVDVADVEERQVKEPDGAGGIIEVSRKFPVWLRPTADYGTPMCEALRIAAKAIQDWTAQNPDSYPPIVINITDGMATDGDPEPLAQDIMDTATNDGDTLLYNIHLSDVSAAPVQYPIDEDQLPDEYARLLFRMSSVFPSAVREQAGTLDVEVSEDSRGFVFNADMVALVHFLDIGTRAATGLR